MRALIWILVAILATISAPAAGAAEWHSGPLPLNFKIYGDSRSLCEQIGDDFIKQAALGEVEDNNPPPGDETPKQYYLKGKIEKITKLSYTDGELITGGAFLLPGGTIVSVSCNSTIVMRSGAVRISGVILYQRFLGMVGKSPNYISFSWGADSFYNALYDNGNPIKDANGEFVVLPPRREWGTSADWGPPVGTIP